MGKIRDQGLSEGYSTQIDWVKGVSKVWVKSGTKV